MKKFNVALIGCGVISENHLIPLIENEKVEIVALCDIKSEKAKEKIDKFNLCSKIYTDYKQMIDLEELDAVHIATPHYLHCEMVLYALAKNVNVFLEKPMCINTDEIEKIIKAEKQSKARVCVCFQNRFNQSTMMAKKLIDEDDGVLTAFGTLFWKRNEEYYAQDAWRGKWTTEGGGVLINQAIHTLDLLCYFLGIPEYVCSTISNHSLKNSIEVEDTSEGVIYFANGKTANYYATNSFNDGSTDFNNVMLFTKNHRIELRYSKLIIDDKVYDFENNTVIGKSCYGIGHATIINKFYEALSNGGCMPVSCEEGQYALRVLLSAYKSADTKIKI